jgi:hypothetical protein
MLFPPLHAPPRNKTTNKRGCLERKIAAQTPCSTSNLPTDGSSFRRLVQPLEKMLIAFVTAGSMVDGAMVAKGAWLGVAARRRAARRRLQALNCRG